MFPTLPSPKADEKMSFWVETLRKLLKAEPSYHQNRLRGNSLARLRVEQLQDRTVPALLAYTAATTGDLMQHIVDANQNYLANATNTYQITLTPSTYSFNTYYAGGLDAGLSEHYAGWHGPNALPGVFSPVTIVGNGATISATNEAPGNYFRFFFVSGGLSSPADYQFFFMFSASDSSSDNLLERHDRKCHAALADSKVN